MGQNQRPRPADTESRTADGNPTVVGVEILGCVGPSVQLNVSLSTVPSPFVPNMDLIGRE